MLQPSGVNLSQEPECLAIKKGGSTVEPPFLMIDRLLNDRLLLTRHHPLLIELA